MEPQADTIRSILIFSELSREDIAKVLGKMEEITFSAGTTIVKQGDQGDAFYLIQSGAVQVIVDSGGGNSEVVAVFGPKDGFGEMALLSGEQRSATIVSVKETTLWRLKREDFDELIEKHPTVLRQFCATLSKRLTHLDRQYATGREAFNSLAEEFYASRPPSEQQFFRHASLLGALDAASFDKLFETDGLSRLVSDLGNSQFPLVRHLGDGKYELHSFFRDFLREKLTAADGAEAPQQLHRKFADRFEAIGNRLQALYHAVQCQDWSTVVRQLTTHGEQLLVDAPSLVKSTLESIPQEQLLANSRLVNLKSSALIQLGDMAGAYRIYQDVLAHKTSSSDGADAIVGYRRMAETLAQRKEYGQAINQLRAALNVIDQGGAADTDYLELLKEAQRPTAAELSMRGDEDAMRVAANVRARIAALRATAWDKWFGTLLGLGLGGYLWFGQPEIGLDGAALRLLGLISCTLIFWVFRVLPDYGVAILFGMTIILTKLDSAQTVMGGFASTTWFMTLGVLGLGASITGSGLFYRLSLHLVRLFPLIFYWQII
ncbi:MAG TPA: cyclic nucleotide-binding domain-containing protein, partial [Candidatus Binatia bacterium]|nr:cyclic nucleotide-binding domain-containing protein [Candidatus Binatia bacterium]